MPDVNIQLVEGGKKAKLTLSYRGDGVALEKNSFIKQLEASEIGKFFLLMDEFLIVLNGYNQFVDALHAHEDGIGTEFSGVVAEKKNAHLRIVIADDEMSADAQIFSAYGGNHVSANQIVKAAQEQSVTFGFDKKAIVALAGKASKSDPGSDIQETIAFGKEPIQGVNAKFEQTVPCFKDRVLKPQKKNEKTDSVNMRDLGVLVSVKPDDVVMKKIPMTKGQRGNTVTGEVMETVDGVDAELNPGDGTQISPKDPNLLVATITGLPRKIERGMAVEDVFEVPKVDVSTGNIDYDGSVIVNGDVGEGMTITANGDINITGYVDSAMVIAGGDIVIGKAAIGRQMDGDDDVDCSTVVKAKGNIFIRHAQYIEIHCDNLVTIEKQLLHSQITAKSVLVGTEENPNGKIIGGKLNLTESLKVGALGAPAGSHSEVSFNQLFDKVVAKRDQLRIKTEEQKNIMEDIKTAVDHIKELPNSEEKKSLLTESIVSFEKHKKIHKHLQAKSKALENKQKDLFAATKVEVKDRIYSGIDFKIGNEKTRTKREHGPSKVFLLDGKLRIDPLTSS
ncbi:MAG: DUF342 domain-containing protein [Algicola sp.]|nr:DUF342 domain-containing protein [Algicola sp.]